MNGIARIALSLTLASLSMIAQSQPVSASERRQPSRETAAADASRDFKSAGTLLRRDLAACEAAPRFADDCLDLLNIAAHSLPKLGGNAQEAEAIARRAVSISIAALGDRDLETATSYSNLASSLDRQGRHAEGEALLRKVIDIRVAVLDPRDPRLAICYHALGLNLDEQGRHADAERYLREAIKILQYQPKSPDLAKGLVDLAHNLSSQERYGEAEPLYRQALTIQLQTAGESDLATANLYASIGFILSGESRLAEAEAMLRKAIDIRAALLGRDSLIAQLEGTLAVNLQEQKRYVEAEILYRRSLGLLPDALGRDHPEVIAGRIGFALLQLRGTGDPAGALTQLRLATAALAERTRLAGTDSALAAMSDRYGTYIAYRVEAAWRLAHAQ